MLYSRALKGNRRRTLFTHRSSSSQSQHHQHQPPSNPITSQSRPRDAASSFFLFFLPRSTSSQTLDELLFQCYSQSQDQFLADASTFATLVPSWLLAESHVLVLDFATTNRSLKSNTSSLSLSLTYYPLFHLRSSTYTTLPRSPTLHLLLVYGEASPPAPPSFPSATNQLVSRCPASQLWSPPPKHPSTPQTWRALISPRPC